MAGFLYFAPGMAGALPEDLERLGVPLSGPQQRQVSEGPGGGPGLLLGGAADALFYRPAEQIWAQGEAPPLSPPAGGGMGIWIGMWRDRRPGPGDLAREDARPGYRVRLGDGAEWVCPLALVFDPSKPERKTMLSEAWAPKAGGGLERRVRECDRRLFEAACRVYDHFLKAAPLPDEEQWAIACEALAKNYRLGPVEIGLLELLGSDTVQHVLGALVDMPTIKAIAALAEKKKAELPASDRIAHAAGGIGSSGACDDG